MMQSITSKGRTVKEAIKVGLELIESSKTDVDIEIIQTETKGFLGIRAKEAIVKLTKKPNKDISKLNLENVMENPDLNRILTKEDSNVIYRNKETTPTRQMIDTNDYVSEGIAWVKDGKLFCKSTKSSYPIVSISQGIKLYKNHQLIEEDTVIVSDKDFYEIKVENEEKKTTWMIVLDEQKIKALLTIEPGYKYIRSVSDNSVNHHIVLELEEKKEIFNTLEFSEVIKRLEELGVKHGFNHGEILKALEATEKSCYEIATGIKPKEGKNGWMELMVETESSKGLKENVDGKINFREIYSIPAVEKGQVIAVVHPPIPGQVGYTVTNHPIPAKQTLPLVIKAGKVITIVDGKIVALESGRPRIEQKGQLVSIDIIPKLTHRGNVNLSTGNLRFLGDIEVLGEVEENMLVEAKGDIYVHNTINAARLNALGAIISYGNVIGSEVSAGKNNMFIAELGDLLGVINQYVEKMIGIIQALTLAPAFKTSDFNRGGLQPLIRILLEKRFKNLPSYIEKYVEVVRKGATYLEDDAWREVSISLSKLFLSITTEVASIDWVIQLSEKMNNLHVMSKTPVEHDCFINIPNALNSRLYSSGNILILGKGCINTRIHAGGSLKISGIVRGGEVYARMGVEINEVGADSGTPTLIAVPNHQKIIVNKAMEGTILQIGNVKHTIKETKNHFIARLDDHDRIVFE